MDELNTDSTLRSFIFMLSAFTIYVSQVNAIICPHLCQCDRRERTVTCNQSEIYSYDALPKENVPPEVQTFEIVNQSLFYFDDSWSDLGLDLVDVRVIHCSLLNMSHDALKGFERLKRLNLEFNYLSEIPFCIQNSSSIRDLRMSYNEIGYLSADTFDNLKELRILELAGNRISTLPEQIFWNLPKLRVIDLSYNFIQRITQMTFINQTRLTDLDLSYNEVTSLSLGWLDSLTRLWELKLASFFSENVTTESLLRLSDGLEFKNLETLDVSQNRLTDPHCDKWRTMRTLVKLHMHSNYISSVPNFCFSDLRELHYIYFSDNNISSLEPFAFENLTHLRMLDLSSNDLSAVPFGFLSSSRVFNQLILDGNRFTSLPDHFIRHGSLYRLDLKNNFIDNISDNAFTSLPKLGMLDLEGNRLKSLTKELQSARSLVYLQLKNNNISVVEEGAFLSNKHLRGILLDMNRLTTLSFETIGHLSNLRWITLFDNPWSCDCHLRWMNGLFRKQIDLPKLEWLDHIGNVRCYTPKRLRHVSVDRVKYPNKMICSSFPPPMTIKLIVGISLSIVGLSTAIYAVNLYCKARKLERNSRNTGKCLS